MSEIATLRPCRSCGRSILLLKNTTTGRWMPVDDKASPQGSIRVDVYRRTAEVLAGDRLKAARAQGEELSQPHHQTCPDARRHRGPSNQPSLFEGASK